MSSGADKKGRGGYRPGAGRKRKPRTTPHVVMRTPPPAEPELNPGDEARKFSKSLRENSGPAIKRLGALLNPESPANFERIEVVTEVGYKDGSIGFLEVRIKTSTPAMFQKGHKNKEYKHIFIGDKIWPLDPETGEERTNRNDFCNTTSDLMDAGLFIPTNSTVALSILRRRAMDKESDAPPPVFIWCEGEKSRLGIEAYLKDDEVVDYLEQGNIEIATLGVLAGKPGAMKTNYVVKPSNPNFVINGVNDEALDLSIPLHIYARDNDFDGSQEAEITCHYLIENGASAESVKIAPPPPGVPPAWDDGDPLPIGVKALDRIKQILQEAHIASAPWDSDKNGDIDWKSVNSQKRAIMEAGIQVMYDYALPAPLMIENGKIQVISNDSIELVNGRLLEIMGHRNRVDMRHATDWEISFRELLNTNPRDSLYEDTMAAIDEGNRVIERKGTSGEALVTPDMLLSGSFGVENNRYHRLVSETILDGCLALWLRNANDIEEPIVFQWYLVLAGEEGIAKTEWAKILAGGKPGPGTYARFGSFFNLSYMDGQGDRLDSPLVSKLGNIAVLDIADKVFGQSFTEKQDGKLKEFAHVSRLKYRMAYGRGHKYYNRRWLPIITVNREDIFSLIMSTRRYVCIDLFPQSRRIIAGGNNGGVDWLYQNRSELLAHAYNAGRYRGDINLSVELRGMVEHEQQGMQSQANWQILLDADLDGLMKLDGLPLERPGIGIAPQMWALWCEDQSPMGGKKISSRAVFDHLRKHRANGHGEWFGGHSDDPTKKVPLYAGEELIDKRLWFFGARNQHVNKFGLYHPRLSVFGRGPFWTLEDGLLGEKPKDFSKQEDPDVFEGGGEAGEEPRKHETQGKH
jgi:hypothetical protein